MRVLLTWANHALQRTPTNSIGTQKQAVPHLQICNRRVSSVLRSRWMAAGAGVVWNAPDARFFAARQLWGVGVCKRLHGVCFAFVLFELSFELRFTTLWLGTAPAAQPTFRESRHRFAFHQKPY